MNSTAPATLLGATEEGQGSEARQGWKDATGRSKSLTDGRIKKRNSMAESNFSKWMSTQEEQKQQLKKQTMEAATAKEVKEVVEVETPMLARGSKKAARRVVRDITEVRRIFNYFDSDGSGTIEPAEFVPMLSRLMRQPASEMDMSEVWKSWEIVDSDGSGYITFDEFHSWYCDTFGIDGMPDFTDFINKDIVPESEKAIREVAKKLGEDSCQVEKMWKEFHKLDGDGSGVLEYPEFEKLMSHTLAPGERNPDIPKKVLHMFWLDIDSDCSGGITFEEFATWYNKFFQGSMTPMEQYYHTVGAGFRRVSLGATMRLPAEEQWTQ